MTEMPNENTATNSESLPSAKPDGYVDQALYEERGAAAGLRAAQEAWLERRGIKEDTPHITVTGREFALLREVGLSDGDLNSTFLIDKAKKTYGIPQEAKYATVDIVPSDNNPTPVTELVAVDEEDFGTIIDAQRLESQGIQQGDIPHASMTPLEFELFRMVGLDGDTIPSLIGHTRDLCGIRQDDQYAPRYALVDVKSDDPSLPSQPLLVDISEEDFGTIIDAEAIAKDFQGADSAPDNSPTFEPGGAVRTVDISEKLINSRYDLQDLATAVMDGITSNPFYDGYNDIGIRAGGLFKNQEDAYVWTTSPLKKSVELTITFPSTYDSVCIVSGQQRAPRNGKAGMAQIDNPKEVMRIEGEALTQMQDIYRRLYDQPDFALTEAQRTERDELFNGHLMALMSEAAGKNRARQQSPSYGQPLQARQLPRH